MNTLKFKTNIKCSGCIAKSTPYLNEVVGEDNWEVDIENPDKILTIATDDRIEPRSVIDAVERAGYRAEKIS